MTNFSFRMCIFFFLQLQDIVLFYQIFVRSRQLSIWQTDKHVCLKYFLVVVTSSIKNLCKYYNNKNIQIRSVCIFLFIFLLLLSSVAMLSFSIIKWLSNKFNTNKTSQTHLGKYITTSNSFFFVFLIELNFLFFFPRSIEPASCTSTKSKLNNTLYTVIFCCLNVVRNLSQQHSRKMC